MGPRGGADLQLDYFNLPEVPGAGTQDSVIGVSTGFVINENSDHKDVAIDFMTLFSSPEFTSLMVDAGGTPIATGAFDRDDIDPRVTAMMELLQGERPMAPPDTGYDLEVADALYAAEAEVLGGVATPEKRQQRLRPSWISRRNQRGRSRGGCGRNAGSPPTCWWRGPARPTTQRWGSHLSPMCLALSDWEGLAH